MKQLESSFTNNRYHIPLRELNVKVWDEEAPGIEPVEMNEVVPVENDHDIVDALPTSPLTTEQTPQNNTRSSIASMDLDQDDDAGALPTDPHMPGISQNTPVNQLADFPGVNPHNGLKSHDQIEEMETRPYEAQPRSILPEPEKPVTYQQGPVMQTPPVYKNGSATQGPGTPLPLTFPQFPPAQSMMQAPPEPAPPSLARPVKRSHKGLFVAPGLLFIVLLASVIAWIVLAQPFSVPEITTTTQHFASATLGISLQYPRNWSTDVHTKNETVSLYDDNHTDQVDITVGPVDSQDLSHYTSEMVSSLGMTGQKTLAELSFAGTTWQQIQGSVQQSGASYTATFLVTAHGGHYYTILQLAPSSTYTLEEQLVFSKIRSSFHF